MVIGEARDRGLWFVRKGFSYVGIFLIRGFGVAWFWCDFGSMDSGLPPFDLRQGYPNNTLHVI